jgi:hypothetical protein
MIYKTPEEKLNNLSKIELLNKLKQGSKSITVLVTIEQILKNKFKLSHKDIQDYLR